MERKILYESLSAGQAGFQPQEILKWTAFGITPYT